VTNPPAAQPVIEPSLDQRVAHATLTHVYARLPLSLVFTLAVSALFYWLLAPFFSQAALVDWFLAIQIVGATRVALLLAYRHRRPEVEATSTWMAWFLVAAVGAAASWSFGAMPLLAGSSGAELTILCLTLLAVSSVAVSSLAAHFPSLAGFLLTALGPTALALMQRDDPIEIVIGYVLCAAIVALGWTGWQSCAALRQQMRADIELETAVAGTRAAQQRAERASQAKSRFLATMSHELRTPLNGMLGLTELLDHAPLDARHRRQLQLIRHSGESLRDILNDILDFSRIEADQLQLMPVEFRLQELLEDVTGLYATRPLDAGPVLELHNAAGPDLTLRGDRLRLRQILTNFVSNALKFTPQGKVTVEVTPVAASSLEATADATFRFSVRDTGVGIAADALERVFEPFTQVDDSYTRRVGGAGLGLAICKRLTELMGGRIGVNSFVGAGSTFWVEVPMHVVQAGSTLTPVATDTLLQAEAPAGTDRPRVLMVEDNEINRLVCGEMLQLMGLDFDVAEHGGLALERARDRHYDLVLMDLQMPVMDGHAATVELRRRGVLARNGAPLPIVALTANAFEDDRRRAMASGMDGFLAKPVRLEDLAAMLGRWVRVSPPHSGEPEQISAAAAGRAARCM
jgi:signal transduction histidine kinase/FixJ family two-component response regulator